MPRRLFLLLSLIALLAGCRSDDVETEYGRTSTPFSKESVNGATVLARLFKEHGAKTTSARRLTPKLSEKADCIVWIPNDFDPPRDEVIEWFEGWLLEKPNRTLIYVARDYDAAVDYWEEVKDQFESKEDRREARSRLRDARVWYETERIQVSALETCPWFSIVEGEPRKVEELRSEFGWLEGVDVEKTDLHLGYVPVFDDWFEPLLETEDGPFVARAWRDDSQIIIVANGSFLLNYPLVNHEHRKLAARLVETADTQGRVVFVESGPGGLKIGENDKPAQSGWDIATRPPFNWMLAQFVALGVVFCFCRWPVFGRPKRLEGESLTDFGKHITALGRLLRMEGDHTFAEEEVRKYHEETGRPGRRA